jgi:hypothetical protein
MKRVGLLILQSTTDAAILLQELQFKWFDELSNRMRHLITRKVTKH